MRNFPAVGILPQLGGELRRVARKRRPNSQRTRRANRSGSNRLALSHLFHEQFMLRIIPSMHRERKHRRRGVTSTEYAIMLALLLGVAMSSINCLGKTTNAVFTYTGQQMGGGGSDDN